MISQFVLLIDENVQTIKTTQDLSTSSSIQIVCQLCDY